MVFHIVSESFASFLQPLPPLQAFERSATLLQQIEGHGPQELLTLIAESVELKQQFLRQASGLGSVPNRSQVGPLSLQALAVGLLCGALDGVVLYRLGVPPDPIEVPESTHDTVVLTLTYIQVADGDWRQLDADALQLQSGYGKHLNRTTEQENIDFLTAPNRGPSDAQRALLETYRTGYSLGLIDSAIVCLHSQPPDRLS